MATQIQYRRGTSTQNDAFTGALGEITVDTTNKTLRVHDGVTAGGNTLVNTYATQTLSFKTLSAPTITGTLSSTGLINTTGNIICASITAGTYVGLSSNKINQNASNITVDTSWVNVAVNGSNVFAVGATGVQNLATTAATSATTGALVVSGGVGIGGNLYVAGNLNIAGNLTTYNANNLTVDDSIIYLAANNGADLVDIGFVGHFVNPGYQHTGFVRDASDGIWKLFANVVAEPTTTVDFTNAVYSAIYTGAHTIYGSPVTAIANGGTSGVGNIGATGATFNTVFAKATTAQYADLAEVYSSDQQYPAGTVLIFGGEAEVTQSHSPNDPRIAGVVSTQPAYLMNHDAVGVPVALQGRVPCRVLGPISKGDRVVSSHIAGVAQALVPTEYEPGCIIGKALQSIDSAEISVIEVVVGRV